MSTNTVNHLKTGVQKTYRECISRDMEAFMLKLLGEAKLSPKLLSYEDRTLYMEHKQGLTLLSILREGERSLAQNAFCKLAFWLYEFDTIVRGRLGFSVRLTDFHFRNFLFCDDNIYGIDFEHWEKGESEDNFASLLAWFSLYTLDETRVTPVFESTLRTVLSLISINREALLYKVEQRRRAILARRAMQRRLQDVTAAVLVGGNSRRMGVNKAQLRLGNYTFLEHILYRLHRFDHLVLSASNAKPFQMYNLPIIEDDMQGIGPLGGICTCLRHIQTSTLFVTACDTPYIPDEALLRLFSEQSGVSRCTQVNIQGRDHPLLALYHQHNLSALEAFVKGKNYKLLAALDEMNAKTVSVQSGHGFQNINRSETYHTMLKKFHREWFPYTTFLQGYAP